jgi:hypothetical protein
MSVESSLTLREVYYEIVGHDGVHALCCVLCYSIYRSVSYFYVLHFALSSEQERPIE